MTREQIAGRPASPPEDLEGVTGLPRKIEGVRVGVTLRQNCPPAAARSASAPSKGVDACAIARRLGGGGHDQAAGCELEGNLENAKAGRAGRGGKGAPPHGRRTGGSNEPPERRPAGGQARRLGPALTCMAKLQRGAGTPASWATPAPWTPWPPACCRCSWAPPAKAVDLQTNHDKEYEAVIRLGERTDTGDVTGTVLETRTGHGGGDGTQSRAARFLGPQMQLPPMYSAVKVGGVPLYKAARQGKEVERTPRPVVIHELEYLGPCGPNEYRLRILCGKGTYVRGAAGGDRRGAGHRGHHGGPAAYPGRGLYPGRQPYTGRDSGSGGERLRPADRAGHGVCSPARPLPPMRPPRAVWPTVRPPGAAAIPSAATGSTGRTAGSSAWAAAMRTAHSGRKNCLSREEHAI